MFVKNWRLIVVCAVALLAITAVSCKEKQASVEELYTTRILGVSYLQRNQLPEAEAEFKKLIDLAPDDPLGYANLGLTYLQAGRLDDAEKQLLHARKLDPRNADVGLALARVQALTGRANDARATLEQLRTDSTRNAHVLYALALLDSAQGDNAARGRYVARLRDVLAVAPANLVARLNLVDAFAKAGQADSAVKELEEVRRIPPEPPKEAGVALDSAIQLLQVGDMNRARTKLDRLFALMEVTTPYQASLEEVKWTEGPIAGRPVITYAPKTFIAASGVRAKAAVEVAKFVEATDEAGISAGAPAAAVPNGTAAPDVRVALAVGDVDGDGTDDLFYSRPGARGSTKLYLVQGGFARDATTRAAISLPGGAAFATFADVDNDGWLDLFAIGGDGKAHLFHNSGTGSFTDATGKSGIGDLKGATKALFVDLDHDGDLDLLLLGPSRAIYRNNLDGTFTDVTSAYGLGAGAASDAAFADFDGDGRIDVYFAAPGGDALFHNGGAQRFSDVTAASGLSGGSRALAVADYDNDGRLDLATVDASGGITLWQNRGGAFVRDARSASAFAVVHGASASSAAFVDYDNDGWVDLIIGGVAQGSAPALFLFRNDGTGKFVDRSTVIPTAVRQAGASSIAVADVDDDGDEDLLIADGAGAPRLLRNEMGNSNLAVNVELKALRTGSGKNNAFGIGSRVEMRAGSIHQTRVATGRVTHFGLGPHLKADVLRIEWPNGVPQTVYFPGSDQDVVEREMLKGSCAFAYTWDGTRFRFVTDAMWRSALGMPLGLMGSTSAFAPAGASQEYVRIPGDALQPRNGRYVMQLTEELWETAYADEVTLVAVDHPDSIDVFVDERFVPPGPVTMQLHQVGRRALPLSAVDERGNDVLPALRATDDVFVSNLVPTQYQGVVEPHDLIMDLGPDAGSANSALFLRGWIYPTDASINVALGQQSAIRLSAPSLEVRGANGKWKVAIPNLSFPSGKDKMLVIALAGKFPTADHHVRIRTNMQIYWDQAFVARTLDSSIVKTTRLEPLSADLHYRGFSRMYRKGGRYGPYWFAYDDVTKESPWRPITGAFTRFGDVRSLLGAGDDMYVIMAPGDEATIEFDASSATTLPKGWKRDFLLYTDGWIKDSDLNTAFGTTVGPLPYHAVRSYPYAPGDAYPTDSAHQRYLRDFDTRLVTDSVSRH
jgi:Flp pilus assembly protein TadD